jgi:hypothetical protein
MAWWLRLARLFALPILMMEVVHGRSGRTRYIIWLGDYVFPPARPFIAGFRMVFWLGRTSSFSKALFAMMAAYQGESRIRRCYIARR